MEKPIALRTKLILIIAIKFIVFFLILRLIFFPNFLKSGFSNDKERADYVRDQLIKRK